MSRMTKTLKSIQKELKDKSTGKTEESPSTLNMSLIEKASFLQEEQYLPNGPLHSTALEDDLSPSIAQDKRPKKSGKPKAVEAGQGDAGTPKRTVHTRRKQTTDKGPISKGSQRQPEGKAKQSNKSRKRQLQAMSEGRESSVSQQRRAEATSPGSANPFSAIEESAEEGSPGITPTQGSALPSSELTSEDAVIHPRNKKSQKKSHSVHGKEQSQQNQKRKSSSGSSEGRTPAKKPKQRVRDERNPIDLDVVLDSFQEFASQYKETVHSDTVKQTIDALSRSFEEQLSEMITTTKELNSVKRKNAKINSAINHTRGRLVDAKNELILKGAEMRRQQKEWDGLEQRLSHLRKGTSFLKDLGELHRNYLRHRQAHPNQEETYGPSSAPALLLEARGMLGVGHQLKIVNEKLQQVLDRAGPKTAT